MPRPSPNRSGRFALFASIGVVVAALYFMREFLIPLALAVLFSFLLAPVVNRLERWRFGRVGSVVLVAVICVGLLGVLGYVVTLQVFDLARQLPGYKGNIVEKLDVLNITKPGSLTQAAKTIEDIQEATAKPATTQATAPTTAEARLGIDTGAVVPRTSITGRDAQESANVPLPGMDEDKPIWVAVAERIPTPLERLRNMAGLVLGPLGTAGLVVVFVFFMLLQREDLRDRMIRLVGGGQLHLTTTALDDATSRISRYLLAQSIVNGTYGLAIGLGLWLIGEMAGDKTFPNFVLWGLLCAILRFIPYIGPWIAAAFPIAVSFAVYPGYQPFVVTVLMFVVVELLSNNAMEPWLYGSSTGMSTIAILVSAVFWTFLWGPIGLLLATPMTVCLVVLGKYVPQLKFLDILLGDEPVLEPPARIYQRLLAGDQEEATDLAHEYLDEMSLERVFDTVLMPALALAEQDWHHGRLDPDRQRFVRSAMRLLIEELADRQRIADEQATLEQASGDDAAPAKAKGEGPLGNLAAAVAKMTHTRADVEKTNGNGNVAAKMAAPAERSGAAAVDDPDHAPVPDAPAVRPRLPKDCRINILLLPAHDEADEIVNLMLAQLLDLQGYCTVSASVTSLAGEMVEMVEKEQANIVVVSALPPAAITHARYLCKRVHTRYPQIQMVIGLWTVKSDLKHARERITCESSSQLVTTLKAALDEIHQRAQPLLIHHESQPATL